MQVGQRLHCPVGPNGVGKTGPSLQTTRFVRPTLPFTMKAHIRARRPSTLTCMATDDAVPGQQVVTTSTGTFQAEKNQLALDLTLEQTMDKMSLDLARFQAFEAYQRELNRRPEDVDLLLCATLMAKATKYPQIEVEAIRREVDRLAGEVDKQLPQGKRYPMQILRTALTVLYHQKGFRGNTIEYYSDDNSYINKLLENKAGIPISLSLLVMEVCKRLGLPMKGVNLPAHFMIQPDVPDLGVLVDAFAGEVIFVEDAADKLTELMRIEVRLDPDHVLNQRGVPPRVYLMRMLHNLKQIYLMNNSVDLALRVIRLMRVTQPDVLGEIRDEGLCLYALARYEEAAEALSAYLKASPQAEDALMAYSVLEGCRSMIKEQQMQHLAEQMVDWANDGVSSSGSSSDCHQQDCCSADELDSPCNIPTTIHQEASCHDAATSVYDTHHAGSPDSMSRNAGWQVHDNDVSQTDAHLPCPSNAFDVTGSISDDEEEEDIRTA